MSGKETQNPVILVSETPKKSWFKINWCTSPDFRTVVTPGSNDLETKNDIIVNKSPDAHAIGRRIPKSVDTTGGFGF
jgi:hypothetical protein